MDGLITSLTVYNENVLYLVVSSDTVDIAYCSGSLLIERCFMYDPKDPDDVVRYMRTFIDEDSWDDLAVVLNHSMPIDDELAASMLVAAGGIDSEFCYEEYKSVEKAVEKLANKFHRLTGKQQVARQNKVFKDTLIIRCHDCHCNSFVADNNEELYPEVLETCWECESKNIEVKKGLK